MLYGSRNPPEACQQRDRRIEAERLGSCQVDDELKFVRKLDRQVAGLGAFENAIDAARCDFSSTSSTMM